MVKKIDVENCIKEMREVISAFLKKNGGLSNGYVTYLEGIVDCRDDYGDFKWSVPQMGDMTGNEIDKIGDEIYEELQGILKKNNIKEMVIEKEHQEYGCYYTIIRYSYRERISLNF